MNILFLHDKYVRDGGAEKYISLRRAELEGEGHHTFLFTLSEEEDTAIKNSRILRYKSSRLFGSYSSMLYVYAELRRYIKETKPDVIYIQNNYEFPYAFLEACRGYEVIQMANDYWIVCPTRWCVHKDDLRICEGGPGLKCLRHGCVPPHLFINHLLRLQYVKKTGIIKGFMACSRNLMDSMLSNGFRQVRLERYPLSIYEGPEEIEREEDLFVYVGGLHRHKGVHLLVEAMKDVLARNPKAGLEVIGSGPEEEALKKRADGCGLSGSIRFLGRIPNSELYRHYKKATAVIVPSIWLEAYCYVVSEALYFRIPVIGSDVGGIREQIDSPEKGVLFERNNKGDLAEKMLAFSGSAAP